MHKILLNYHITINSISNLLIAIEMRIQIHNIVYIFASNNKDKDSSLNLNFIF